MKKRITTISLALILTLSIFTFSASAIELEFSDMPDDWSTVSLQNAVKNGLLRGNEGKINPQDNLTRAEMAAVINRVFGSENKAPIDTFNDVSVNAWYHDDMAKAVQMKTFIGGGDNTLRPDSYITREEAFVVINRSFKLAPENEGILDQFKDKDQISAWAQQATAALVKQNIVLGFDGNLNPQANIKRAEFAKIMDNLVKFYINESKTYSTLPQGNIMINKPDVTIKNVTIEGDLILGDGVGEGNVTLENVNIKNRLVVRGGGANSVYVKGNSTIENIIIGKIEKPVRLVSENTAKVTNVIIDGYDNVNLEGKFTNLAIKSQNIEVNSKNSTIATVTLDSENSKILIDENSTINELTLKSNNNQVEINGKVESLKTTDKASSAIIVVGEKAQVNKIEVFAAGTKISGNIKTENITIKAENVTVEKTTPVASGGGGGATGGSTTPTTPTTPKVDYKQIMESSLNNSWDEFTETVNGQNKLIASYSASTKRISITVKENKDSLMAVVQGTGLKTGFGDVLNNPYVNEVSSGSNTPVSTRNSDGTKKSIDELQEELYMVLLQWARGGTSNLYNNTHSIDLYCTADDGTEVTYTYTFDFN